MKIKKSTIVSAIERAGEPVTFEEIAEAFWENIDLMDLYAVLAEMVARKRLVSFVDDEGRVVYAINQYGVSC